MKIRYSIAAVAVLSAFSHGVTTAQEKIQATDMIDIFEKLGGEHPGNRRAHAKGLCATATFSPNPSAPLQQHFDNADLLKHGERQVLMRFSLGGGNPNSDERAPGTRGVGMQIKLPDGRMHVFTGNNFPSFAGKDPDTFHGFLSTLLPDEKGVSDPSRTMKFIMENPSVQAHAAWQQSAKTPASYANTQFFGLHTFFYDKPNNETTKFRWQLIPNLGVKTLEKDEAASLDENFLAPTLAKQMASDSVSYTMIVHIGKPQDTNIDPSQPWPDDREQVTLGKVTLNSAGGDACTGFNFDPNILSANFRPSKDPVLQMRSAAYAISFGKRLSGQ